MTFSILVEGKVQNVGFRYFIFKHAIDMDLKGWVKNQIDGSVLIYVNGDYHAVLRLIEFARKGPQFSKVLNLKVDEIADFEYDKFEIRKDF